MDGDFTYCLCLWLLPYKPLKQAHENEIIAPSGRLVSGVIRIAPCCANLPILWGEDPIAIVRQRHYNWAMNILLIMVVLLLLVGGGGFYMGGPVIGGSGLGLVLLICLVIYLAGGFRTKNN